MTVSFAREGSGLADEVVLAKLAETATDYGLIAVDGTLLATPGAVHEINPATGNHGLLQQFQADYFQTYLNVALSGNTLAALKSVHHWPLATQISILTRSGSGAAFSPRQELPLPQDGTERPFGFITFALSGNVLVAADIGSRSDDVGIAGVVWTYVRSDASSAFSFAQKLYPPVRHTNDHFGYFLRLEGNLLAVGGQDTSDGIHLYRFDSSTLAFAHTQTIPVGAVNGLALSNNVLIFSRFGDRGGAVFRLNSATGLFDFVQNFPTTSNMIVAATSGNKVLFHTSTTTGPLTTASTKLFLMDERTGTLDLRNSQTLPAAWDDVSGDNMLVARGDRFYVSGNKISVFAATCGNGTLDPGEDCDDGANASGDGCSAHCRQETCGNGFVDPDEACDKGNDNGDICGGCSTSCQAVPIQPTCGPNSLQVPASSNLTRLGTAGLLLLIFAIAVRRPRAAHR